MLLDNMIGAVTEKHQNKPISHEAYHRWRTSAVTRRLMEELEINLIETLTEDMHGIGEELIRKAMHKQATKESIEAVLNWKPLELVGDEDD